MKITRPKFITTYAVLCLEALQRSGLGKFIVLGGALGLSYYYEYRTTKDVDAWWTEEAGERDKERVIALVGKTLETEGEVVVRRFGDVVSVDLRKEDQVIFNFQIAARSARLREPVASDWSPVTVDSFEDLVASKMTAVIERGAPRDFLDIFEICKHTSITISKCWELWKEREAKKGNRSPDPRLGCEGLLLHLSRIEKLRPLSSIDDPEQRTCAEELRTWYRYEFCAGKIELD